MRKLMTGEVNSFAQGHSQKIVGTEPKPNSITPESVSTEPPLLGALLLLRGSAALLCICCPSLRGLTLAETGLRSQGSLPSRNFLTAVYVGPWCLRQELLASKIHYMRNGPHLPCHQKGQEHNGSGRVSPGPGDTSLKHSSVGSLTH